MTSILADFQYSLNAFPPANYLNVGALLSSETIAKINRLAHLVGAPTYQKTPIFHNKQQNSRRSREKQVISSVDWETVRNFKTTQLDKNKDGVEKDIDDVRGLLNKLTSNNYEEMKNNIISLLKKIIDKNCKEAELEKIGATIFEIGSINKFWSALYAKLYKTIIATFPLMENIYQTNFKNFMSLFDNIRFVNAEEDYDEFCNVNKENEKRRSVGSFFVHLMNNDVIETEEIMDFIYKLKNKMFILMNKEGKKNEVAEFAENIAILISNGKNKLQTVNTTPDNNFTWSNCTDFIIQMANEKPSNYPSLSNKVIFKFMDIEDEL